MRVSEVSEVSEQYQQEVLAYIKEIKDSGKPVIIFGACRGGWYAMKALEHYGVPINAFADNNPSKHGEYYNYAVYSPEDIAVKFPDAIVFLGVFTPNAADAIRKQLHVFNFHKICYATAAFLFIYMTVVAGRKCNKEVLAQSIHILFEYYSEDINHYGYTKDNYFVSPFVTGVITQKCSLRCRDCGQRIPYYKSPFHYSVESIVNDIKQYAKAFDVVPEISLHGGEPFLHPDILEICREVSRISNIVFVSFVTNGTILPSDNTLSQLSACGADIQQSDYGSLSKKQDEVFIACRRHNIYSDILYTNINKMWTMTPTLMKHNRSAEDNSKIYQNCVSSKICCQIMDGELHRCPFSMHASHQGLFPKFKNDFVRLDDPNVTDESLREKVRLFLTKKESLNMCDYCDPSNVIEVPPAIQLEVKKTLPIHLRRKEA